MRRARVPDHSSELIGALLALCRLLFGKDSIDNGVEYVFSFPFHVVGDVCSTWG